MRLAPAKINLALHIIGQRADGHHLLESLVVFADIGDRIGLSAADEDGFSLSGRFAHGLGMEAGSNLVLKARDALRVHLTESGFATGPVKVHLEKNLPVASGIGGGSADAAATLLGLVDLWAAPIAPAELKKLALELGADVPMCLESRPLVARGIGGDIDPVEDFPALSLLLINPLRPVPTPQVFARLVNKINPPFMLPALSLSSEGWIESLAGFRNDLQPPASAIEPEITAVCAALSEAGAHLVRMSGSGATCFGLFAEAQARDAASAALCADHPGWYVTACNSMSSKDVGHGRT